MKQGEAYIVLLRGVNVGGKNKLSMAALKQCLEVSGFWDVKTYIASGNVVLRSDQKPAAIKAHIEKILPTTFKLDSAVIKVLVITYDQLKGIIAKKPKGFGDTPDKYHSDAIFLIDISVADAMPIFTPRAGIDKIWSGDNVIYSQRLSAKRTQSRLSKIVASKLYQSMTIRSWNTTLHLLAMVEANAD